MMVVSSHQQLKESQRWLDFLDSIATGLQLNLVLIFETEIVARFGDRCPVCGRDFNLFTMDQLNSFIPDNGEEVTLIPKNKEPAVLISLHSGYRAFIRVCSCASEYPSLELRAKIARNLIGGFQTTLISGIVDGKAVVELSALRQINRLILSLFRDGVGTEQKVFDLILSALVIILEAKASWLEYYPEGAETPVLLAKGDQKTADIYCKDAHNHGSLAVPVSNGVFQGTLGVALPEDLKQAEKLLPIFAEECNIIFEINRLFNLVQSRLGQVLGALENAVLLVDSNRKIVYANQNAGELLGHDYQELIGKSAMEWGGPWEIQVANGTVVSIKGYKERLAGGESGRLVDWQITPIKDRDAVSGWLIIATDRTEFYYWQDMGRRAEGIAAVTSVIGPLAHELRNPLSAIKAMLQLSSRKKEPEKISGYLELSLREIDRMALLVNDFLHLGRAVGNKSEPVDLYVLLNELVPLFKSEAIQVGIEVSLKFTLVPLVLGTPKEMTQVILNLFRNAVEACREQEQGLIELRLETVRDSIVFEVEDNGPGLTPEAQEHLFKPFFTTKERGTGLGLAVVKAIINGQGGQITGFNSAKGGALFRISLPKYSGEQSLRHQVDVLVIVNDEMVRYPSEHVIIAAGFMAISLEDLSDLMEEAKRYEPRIIVTDFHNQALINLIGLWSKAKYIVYTEEYSNDCEAIIQILRPPDYAQLVEAVRKLFHKIGDDVINGPDFNNR